MSTLADEAEGRQTSLSFARAMLIVFAPFACGYFFSYFYRTVNAIVAPNLRDDVGVNAAELGLLSAIYFLTFAACQIPLGVMLDRFGPRRVQGTLYCLAGAGALLFSLGESVVSLILARALIGIGVSGGLMAALKAIVMWFPRERIPMINGWYFASGGLGALAATAPVEFVLQFTDWRGLFVILAAATVVAALFILFVVPEKASSAAVESWASQIKGLGWIFTDSYFWRIVPLMFTCASGQLAIQGLWAGPWLSDVDGFGRPEIANHLLLAALGMTIGVLLSGPYAAVMKRRGISIAAASAIAGAVYTVVLLLMVMRLIDATYIFWAAIGLLGTQTSLVFAALAQYFPESHIGRANTGANVMVFGMAFAYQFGIGAVIELWQPLASGGYPPQAYVIAFLIVVATQVAALVWYLLPIGDRYDYV
jgi:predicted MFS family arabinose efflux permease